MRILAFDQASLSGWCFGGSKIDFKDWETGHFQAPKRPEVGERLLIVFDSARKLIERFKPDLMAWETPYDPTWDAVKDAREGKEQRVFANRDTMNFLQQVAGAIQMAAARHGVPTESYPPQSWQSTLKLPPPPPSMTEEWAAMTDEKKRFAARRKWKKEEIVRAVIRLGGKVQTSDEADAWGICLHACHGKPAAKRAQGDLLMQADL